MRDNVKYLWRLVMHILWMDLLFFFVLLPKLEKRPPCSHEVCRFVLFCCLDLFVDQKIVQQKIRPCFKHLSRTLGNQGWPWSCLVCQSNMLRSGSWLLWSYLSHKKKIKVILVLLIAGSSFHSSRNSKLPYIFQKANTSADRLARMRGNLDS